MSSRRETSNHGTNGLRQITCTQGIAELTMVEMRWHTSIARGPHGGPFGTEGYVIAGRGVNEELCVAEVEEIQGASFVVNAHGEVVGLDVS